MNTFRIYIKNEKASGLFGFLKRQHLKKEVGEITFHSDKIIIDGKEFLLSSIEKVSIPYFNDYIGRTEGNKPSEGNGNVIELYESEKGKQTYYILLERRYQLRDVSSQLIAYYKAGKFDFENLTLILGLENYNAIQNFKNTLSIKSY